MDRFMKAIVAALLAVIAGAGIALKSGQITLVGVVVFVAGVAVAFFTVYITPNAPATVPQSEALDTVYDGVHDALVRLGLVTPATVNLALPTSLATSSPSSTVASSSGITVTAPTNRQLATGGIVSPGALWPTSQLGTITPGPAAEPPSMPLDFSSAPPVDGTPGSSGASTS